MFLCLASGSFLTSFRTKILYDFLVFRIVTTPRGYHQFLNFTISAIVGDLYKAESFYKCELNKVASD